MPLIVLVVTPQLFPKAQKPVTLFRTLKWMPVLFAAFSLVAVQMVHSGEADAAHTDDALGHSHEISHESGDGTADGHGDAEHCVTHGACHLLQHAMGSVAQDGSLSPNMGHANWRLRQYRVDGLTLTPPTPPPLV